MQQTTNYALKKPDGTDTVDISVLNGNMDTIDSELKKRAIDNYAVTTNSGNAYSATINGITALADGLQVRLKFNAGATAPITLNINGLGACKVCDYYGNQVSDVHGGFIANLAYDAGTGNFILQGKGGGGNAQPAHLLNGETATTNSGPITGTMVNYSALHVQASQKTTGNYDNLGQAAYLMPPKGYYDGTAWVYSQENNLTSDNIKSGATIFGISGKSSVVDTADATATAGQILNGQSGYVNGSKVTGTMSNQPTGNGPTKLTVWNDGTNTKLAVGIPYGAYLSGSGSPSYPEIQCIENNLVSGNIRAGSSIFGVSGKSSIIDTSDANASAGQMLSGQSAYVNGTKVVGTMANNSSATNALSVGSSGTSKYFRIPYGAYLQNNGQGYPEIVASATAIDSNISSGNIKAGVSICGVAGKSSVVDTGDATATASQIASGQSAYVNGSKVVGNNNYISGKTISDSSYSVLGFGGAIVSKASIGSYSLAKIAIDTNNNAYIPSGASIQKINSMCVNVCTFSTTNISYAVTVDSSGNVYVGLANGTVMKFNSIGNVVWTYTGFTGNNYDIKVDSNGNIIVINYAYLFKLSSSGTLIWKASISTTSTIGIALGFDSSGNIFFTDTTSINKYNSSGTFLSSTSISSHGLAIDTFGNMYTAPTTDGTAGIEKLDSNGNIIWSSLFSVTNFQNVRLDSNGDVYGVGQGASAGISVVKLSNQGTEKWRTHFFTGDGYGIYSAYNIAIGTSGICFVSGTASSGGDYTTWALNSATTIKLN